VFQTYRDALVRQGAECAPQQQPRVAGEGKAAKQRERRRRRRQEARQRMNTKSTASTVVAKSHSTPFVASRAGRGQEVSEVFPALGGSSGQPRVAPQAVPPPPGVAGEDAAEKPMVFLTYPDALVRPQPVAPQQQPRVAGTGKVAKQRVRMRGRRQEARQERDMSTATSMVRSSAGGHYVPGRGTMMASTPPPLFIVIPSRQSR